MVDWRRAVCRDARTPPRVDIEHYVSEDNSPEVAPIDSFYRRFSELIRAASPSYLQSHPIAGPVFYAGIFACIEEFIRELVGRLIAICPVAQKCCSAQQIHLGSAIWHRGNVVSRGALEHFSLAGKKNLESTLLKFLGVKLSQRHEAFDLLDDFERLAELRHAVVHSGFVLPGKNALALGLDTTKQRRVISIGFDELQESADVISELAVALNRDLFQEFCARWSSDWRQGAFWLSKTPHQHFKSIWDIFYSVTDGGSGNIPAPWSVIKCRNAVERELV